MSNEHEVHFRWPRLEPNTVILTGSFDKWARSYHLKRGVGGFEGSVKVAWGEKIAYKFIVDGRWMVLKNAPTERDNVGNLNNVYTAPPKPTEPTPPQADDSKQSAMEHGVENPETLVVPDSSPEQAPEAKTVDADAGSSFPRLVSEFADTVAAREGTTSALDYVASGFGAALSNVVGVDPINAGQIAIPTPKGDGVFDHPNTQVSPPTSSALEVRPESPGIDVGTPLSSPIPIAIVPVNAAENNTSAADVVPEGAETQVEIKAEEGPGQVAGIEASTHSRLIRVSAHAKQTLAQESVSVENGVPAPTSTQTVVSAEESGAKSKVREAEAPADTPVEAKPVEETPVIVEQILMPSTESTGLPASEDAKSTSIVSPEPEVVNGSAPEVPADTAPQSAEVDTALQSAEAPAESTSTPYVAENGVESAATNEEPLQAPTAAVEKVETPVEEPVAPANGHVLAETVEVEVIAATPEARPEDVPSATEEPVIDPTDATPSESLKATVEAEPATTEIPASIPEETVTIPEVEQIKEETIITPEVKQLENEEKTEGLSTPVLDEPPVETTPVPSRVATPIVADAVVPAPREKPATPVPVETKEVVEHAPTADGHPEPDSATATVASVKDLAESQPQTNGHEANGHEESKPDATVASKQAPSPSSPPSPSASKTNGSLSPSKSNTLPRKKKTSILTKLKRVFSHSDKEKGKSKTG